MIELPPCPGESPGWELDLPIDIGEPNGLFNLGEFDGLWTYVLTDKVIERLSIPADVLLMYLVIFYLFLCKKGMAIAFGCAYPHHGFL